MKGIRTAICLVLLVSGPLTGGIRLQVREGRPIVDGVYVNAQGPYRFLIDTGTNMNLIETGLAHKIGMKATFQDVVESSVGRTLMPGSDGNVVALGDVRAEAQRFQYSNLDSMHTLWPDIRGVLGQWFLRGFDYKLDLRARTLEFGRQIPNGSRTRLKPLDGRNAISTSLGDLVLDSGASRLILFGVRAGVGDMSELLTFTGSKRVGMVSSQLAIEGRKVWRGDAVALPDRTEPGVAGLMPLSLFRKVYICNSEGYAVFE